MGRKKSEGEIKSHQQHLLMAPSEIEAIDDWSFKHRIRSRGEAMRRLIQIGLATTERLPEAHEASTHALQVLTDQLSGHLRKLERGGGDIEKDYRSTVRAIMTAALPATFKALHLVAAVRPLDGRYPDLDWSRDVQEAVLREIAALDPQRSRDVLKLARMLDEVSNLPPGESDSEPDGQTRKPPPT